jgi:putative membrane protein
MWWHDGWSWWGWLLMSLGMVAFWGLVAWAVVLLVRRDRPAEEAKRPSPEEIVRERFARGEIDEQEYEERLEALSSGGRPGARGNRSA